MSAAETTAIDSMTAANKAAGSKLWRQAVTVLRPLADAGHDDAVLLLSEVLCAAGRPAEAAEVLAPVVTGSVVLMKQLGDCYLQAQQCQQALNAYKAALDLHTDQQQQAQLQAMQHAHQHAFDQQQQPRQHSERHCQHQQAQCARLNGQETASDTPTAITLQAFCAAAMYPSGGAHAEAAVHLVQSILQQQQQQRQPGQDIPVALRLYAQIAADKGHWAAAASAAVRLLSQIPQDREGARLLALATQEPSGMQALLSTVLADAPPLGAATVAPAGAAAAAAATAGNAAAGSSTAPALGFLAHTLLTQRAVQQAVELYGKAVQHNPKSSSCALGLAQALEVQCDYAGILQAVLGFCNANPEVQLGLLSLQTVAQMPALQRLSQQPLQPGSLQWYHAASAKLGNVCERRQEHPQHRSQQQESQTWLQQQEVLVMQLRQEQLHATQQLQAGPGIPAAPAAVTAPVDLEALALLMTAAKVLFCGGALTAAAQLLQLLLPAEQAAVAAAGEPLHQSSIRNEAAYAALMRKLLSGDLSQPASATIQSIAPHLQQPQNGAVGETHVLYVCGDSHILPLAWRTLIIDGLQHLMVPLLVTGCKVWHLRRCSAHPCSKHFNKALASVPVGSKVLLVLGEIDCREGLLMAVEKFKYETLQEAVTATVEVYVRAAQQLAQQRQLQLWVHCVPPVLPETRQVVQLFNKKLQQRLQQSHDTAKYQVTSSALQDQPKPHLAQDSSTSEMPWAQLFVNYVDLEGVLLQDAACLDFDGTHLQPRYVRHLQAAMACNSTE